MPTPTFRQAPTHNAADQAQFQLTQAADVGDWLVAIHGADFYTAADVGAPTGGHTWTQQAVDTNGSDLPHLKVFTAQVTSGGDQAVTFPTVVDTVHYGWLGVLVGVDSVDGAAGGGSASATSSHVAPSVIPTGDNSLLLCSWIGGGDVDDATAVSYTAIPGAMTDQGHQQGSSGPFHSALQAASEALASSGATGTRTATFSRAAVYASVSVAFAGTTVTLSDTFTDTNGTLLGAHSPNIGGAWQAMQYGILGTTPGSDLEINLNTIRSTGSGGTAASNAITYRNSTDPGADEYDIACVMSFFASPQGQRLHWVEWRVTPTGDTDAAVDRYVFLADSSASQEWLLFKQVGGTTTQLDIATGLLAGNVFDVLVEVRSGSMTVSIDGVPTLSSTEIGRAHV